MNMKKFGAIIVGSIILISGCHQQAPSVVQTQQTQQTQEVQHNDGISLAKAIDLQRKGEFTPQRVQFEGWSNDTIFGDEPEIVVHSSLQLNNKRTTVHIHIKDRATIERLAKYQKDHNTKYTRGTSAIDVSEITFDGWKYDVQQEVK